MKWFNGSIDDAIKEAKQRNSMFIVYVEGDNKSSEVMNSVINGRVVTSTFEKKNFVCIRITSDSDEFIQFQNIYKHVPVPSIFLIGLNGVPVSIIKNSNNENAESLSQQLLKALTVKQTTLNLKVDNISEKSEEITSLNSEMIDKPSDDESMQDSLPLTVSGILGQHASKDSAKTEDPTEKQKKEDAENANSHVKGQSENNDDSRLHLLQLEKIRTENDRIRILHEIAMDKQERMSRQRELDNTSPNASRSFPSTNNNNEIQSLAYNQTYIQFRKPDGSTCTEVFLVTNVINDLRTYVTENMHINSRQFKLATAFPRHIFTDDEINKSLEELHLVPNAVIIIIPISDDNSPVTFVFSRITSTILLAATPFVSLYEFIRNSIFGVTPPQITGGVLQRPITEPSLSRATISESRRPTRVNSVNKGNIRTMSSINEDKDKDRNNVWNGNSTQQSQ